MTISGETRHRLYLRLEEVLGPDEATVLMEHLPPTGWADVATKRDIDGLAAATKGDIDGLAAATKGDIEGLAAATKQNIEGLAAATKQNIDGLAAATKRDIEGLETKLGSLETRLDLKFDAFGSRIEAKLERGLRGMEHELRLFTWRVLVAMLTLVSLAVAAARV